MNNSFHSSPAHRVHNQIITKFDSFSFNIPDGVTLDLRIQVQADSASQEVAFDNLMVKGDLNVGPGITYDTWAESFGLIGPNAAFDADVDLDGGKNGRCIQESEYFGVFMVVLNLLCGYMITVWKIREDRILLVVPSVWSF